MKHFEMSKIIQISENINLTCDENKNMFYSVYLKLPLIFIKFIEGKKIHNTQQKEQFLNAIWNKNLHHARKCKLSFFF